MRLLAIFISMLPLFGACGTGSITITGAQVPSSGVTHRQAVVVFNVPHANNATVQIYSDSACSKIIDDTNVALFPGSFAANRTNSVIDGQLSNGSRDGRNVQFVAGTLMGNRALAQNTQYWAQITNLADASQVTIPFSTNPMPVGNLYPEQPAADITKWDNRGYPVFTPGVGNRNKVYTDPTTGAFVKPFTQAGDAFGQGLGVGDGINNPPQLDTPIDSSSPACTSPANLSSTYNVRSYPTAPTSGYASCSGTVSVWLPFASFLPPGGGSSWSAGTGANGAYAPSTGLDYWMPYVWASATAGTPTITVALAQTPGGSAYHGCQFTAAVTATNTGYIAVDPDPGFATLCTSTPIRGDIVPSLGTVNVSGTAVTLASGDYFQATWPAGAYLKIAGSSCTNSFCQIASVNSATSITLQSSGGTLTGAAYASRTMGVRITAMVPSGTMSLQVGYAYGTSPFWQVDEDSGQQHCNSNPVTVTANAAGVPYSGFTLNGYECWLDFDALQRGAFYLVIPQDQNGMPLGENRIIGTTSNQQSFTSNGATLNATTQFQYAGPDPVNGNKFYVSVGYTGNTALLLSATFDSTRTGAGTCNPLFVTWQGAQKYPSNGNNPQDSCITYTNLTNPTTGQDVVAQITAAYATFNPGFSMAGFELGNITFFNEFFSVQMLGNFGTGTANPGILIGATFNTSGVLTQVYDSFSQFPFRWGAVHGPTHALGSWHGLTADVEFGNSGVPLAGPWVVTPTRVNLAGFGSATNWTAATTLDNGTTNQYLCPTSAQMEFMGTSAAIATALVALGSAGNHCIEIEVQSEPCNPSPPTGANYPGGKTEAQQFPCSTNSARSLLQPMQPGDGFMDSATFQFGEYFIILTKTITTGTCTAGSCVIDLWLIRGSGIWPNNLTPAYRQYNTHANGWSGYMEALQVQGCTPFFADSATSVHTWIEGYFGICLSHGALGAGNAPSTANAAYQDENGSPTFDVFHNLPQGQAAMPPWGKQNGAICSLCNSPEFPAFGNATNSFGFNGNQGGSVQLYGDAGQLSAPADQQVAALFQRHLNPSGGSVAETPFGLGTSGYTLSLVTGKSQTYTVTDPYSAGGPNQKLTPLLGWAGHSLLPDYSGAAANTLPDSGYGVCYALNTNECVTGSTVNKIYVTAPAASGYTQAIAGQHSQNAPGVISAGPAVGQVQQVNLNTPDPDGRYQRILGEALTGFARTWQFNEPKALPTGDWYLVSTMYKDGLRTETTLAQNPRYVLDSNSRGGYVNVPVALSGSAGDTVRVEFWYAEWGGINGRAEHGYTSSTASAAAPFQWASETQSYISCSSGCAVNIPAISGRLVYLAVHRKNGSTEAIGRTQVIAVP